MNRIQTRMANLRIPLRASVLAAASLAAALAADSVEPQIQRLASDQFEIREAAHRALLEQAENDHVALLKRLLPLMDDAGADPELRVRASRLVAAIFERHKFEEKDGFIGITIGNGAVFENNKLVRTVQVMGVVPGLQGDLAGLQAGDQIAAIDGQVFDSPDATGQFMTRIGYTKPGTKVRLKIRRANREMDLDVTLMQRPSDMMRGLYDRDEDLDKTFGDWLKQNRTKRPTPPIGR